MGAGQAEPGPAFPLRAGATGRYLIDAGGRPFFYQADTAWNLPKKLTLAEAEAYLDDRKARGFTAIQIQAVSREQGPAANREGQNPFDPLDDILRPNEPYWRHLDRVLEAARSRGFVVAIAALWVRSGGADREGWRSQLTDENARAYGRFLGRRTSRFDNLIWILGGDADPAEKTPAIRQLALGLRETAPNSLLTYHAAPDHSSASVLPDESWLDLNMAYTYREVQLHLLPEVARTPVRPILLGESGYEEEDNDHRGGDPARMRRQAYRAILCGAAAGHAFGNKHIWRFDADWRAALASPASRQMAHVRALFAARPWYRLVPDTGRKLLAGGDGEDDVTRVIAAITDGGRLAVAYLPAPRPLTVDLTRFPGPVTARWFDPTDGSYRSIGAAPFLNILKRTFAPPPKNAAGDGDWVLVLEAN